MMATPKHFPAERKQFRLVKYFAWASFIMLVIISFPFSVFLSHKSREVLLASYEHSAILVGQNLNHQVFRNFVIPVTIRFESIRLREEEQYKLMDQVVRNTIQGFNVDVVNIYDIGKGVIAYSTDPKLIGVKVQETEGYLKAFKGEHSSRLIPSGIDLRGVELEILGGKHKLRTYIPFTAASPYQKGISYVAGVFELIQDLTPQYQSVVDFQWLVFGLTILIMGLIFLTLLLVVHKAERLIEQRAKEQRELEAQLHQAERLAALGEMVAGVSHEIKNPLGIIQSTAELLEGLPEAGSMQKKLSGVIKEESKRLNRIVSEFLDFARPQEPNIQPCHVEEVVEKNLTFLAPEMEKRKIKVNNHIHTGSFIVWADEGLLYRVFLNILINAIHSMNGGGEITLRAREEETHCLIEIEDTGCGISRENLRKIFNPFFTTKEKGTGLGLSIVKKIIEGHHGTLTIESAEGRGTKVGIHLPRKS